MRRIQIAIGAGIAAALGAIAATVWVALAVREETVVAHPYEDGLRQDAERHARAALGLAVSIGASIEAGVAPLEFALRDRDGNPVDDAAVAVELSRPATSRGERSAAARSLGAGRWSAAVAFPEPGPWDVRFDVQRGNDRVRLERRVGVRAACDLAARPCARAIPGGGELALELAPRPLRTMAELAVKVTVREPTPTATATATTTTTTAVAVSFSMPGMTMGENRTTLAPIAPGTWGGKAVLVRCASGRRDWVAEVELAAPGGAPRAVRFPLTLPEDAR